MPTRTFTVPMELAIEADTPEVAIAEAERIRAAIEAEPRHLKVTPKIPRSVESPSLPFTFPDG
jgi:hypothetical protein